MEYDESESTREIAEMAAEEETEAAAKPRGRTFFLGIAAPVLLFAAGAIVVFWLLAMAIGMA
ncbi:hypothetical protein LOC54_04620 [Acetobacter sp. AN02]|uniref:hypothetical protein n=1 Tax=Acetobacter sp. AN02 TaxID=2894186 RepID=UPI00243414D4|nr:hypothetical protein [Acetobacter sp. AN02]MDG6094402.1 hypothetical protein [Acetobacter sp. AN02]